MSYTYVASWEKELASKLRLIVNSACSTQNALKSTHHSSFNDEFNDEINPIFAFRMPFSKSPMHSM